MNYAYSKHEGLEIDDIFATKRRYGGDRVVFYQGTEYYYIDESPTLISKNFKSNELYSNCEVSEHLLSKRLVDALQYIRDVYDTPIVVTSTYRTEECNAEITGSSKTSQHIEFNAIDFKFVTRDAQTLFLTELQEKGCIFTQLLNMGVRGFGGYNSHFHIDTRESGGKSFAGMSYASWGLLDPYNLTECCE